MKMTRAVAYLMALVWLVALSGCGSDRRESGSVAQLVASQACIGCHNGTASSVTGNSVVTEWLNSAHSKAAGGAGCDDCHHVDGHPGNGSIPPLPAVTVCVTCHTATVAMGTRKAHFSNLSASYTGYPLGRLGDTIPNPATGDTRFSSCNGCHNPHDPTSLLSINKQWADSAHSATTDDAFKESTWIKRDTVTATGDACNRCHSATGYRYYVTHGQSPITRAILGRYSSAKEVVACYACHTDFSWRRIATDTRPATAGFTPPAFVNFSTPYTRFSNVGKRFPGTLTAGAASSDMGDSKLCVPCHGGRRGSTGASISGGANATSPHHFQAAGVMYMKIGFIDFTSQSAPIPAAGTLTATTYGKTLISSDDLAGGVTSTHRKLGTTSLIGDHGITASQTALLQGGPCVVCHMTAGHTLNFDNPTVAASTYNQVCINCHTSERGTPLNAGNFLSAFVDENRDQMTSALALGVKLLETKYDITVQVTDVESPESGSFVKKSNPALSADFTRDINGNLLTASQQYKLRGAAFNLMMGYQDNTAFLHARTYMRRLIYDAIDFLDNGFMDLSVGATALSALGHTVLDANGVPAFGKGATAFADATLTALAAGTTPSMTYLIGFDRTTGAWTPALRERP